MRETGYARELATASIDGQRIERIYVKDQGQDEIRFSWWKEGRMIMRPLDLPEAELLPLLQQAMMKGVFSEKFLKGLHDAIYDARREASYADET